MEKIANWKTLPKEIKLKMLEYQLEQTGQKDKKVLKKDITATGEEKNGFSWKKTEEGYYFWASVIMDSKFDLFFEKYPKPHFSTKDKKLNDTYNIVNIIKKNKDQIKFIKKNYYDFDNWELPDKYYQEVKNLKEKNKMLLNKLFKLYENEK